MNPTRVQFICDSLLKEHHTKGRHAINVLSGQFIYSSYSLLSNILLLYLYLKGMRVLDCGCGGGLLSESLARLGADVVAIDPSESNIAVARAHSELDPMTSCIEYRNCGIGMDCFISLYYSGLNCSFARGDSKNRRAIRCCLLP
jgi:2-polyprenyl-3-methyl-5-hydroxy-6-metoxy-1,4-benzoquinol methylase